MSVSEKWLWAYLRSGKTGFKFRRQHPLDRFVLDFYCAEALFNVEVDGEQHRETERQDRERDRAIAKHGILTLRIPSIELFEGWDVTKVDWHKRIVEICEERSGRKAFEPKATTGTLIP